MPDFTDEQIRDARENPRPGDVWRWDGMDREVWMVTARYVQYFRGEVDCCMPIEDWGSRMARRNATLIRRSA